MIKKTIKQIAYMLTSNRFRVAFLTVAADVVVLFGLELTPEKAEIVTTILTAMGAMMVAALSYRDPTSSRVEAIPGNISSKDLDEDKGE